MDFSKVADRLIEHLSEITDEEFDRLLVEAGIESCPDIPNQEEFLIEYDVSNKNKTSSWGNMPYNKQEEGIWVKYEEVA